MHYSNMSQPNTQLLNTQRIIIPYYTSQLISGTLKRLQQQ